MSETFEHTLKSGRIVTLRPLPKHFFVYYGELPSALSNLAVSANNEKEFGEALQKKLSPEELKKLLIFIREAVNYACVSPRITLTPNGKDEISPFELTEEEFGELSALAMKSAGGSANGLSSFRGESNETSAHSTDGA